MFGSIQEMIVNIPVVLFAITVHEYAQLAPPYPSAIRPQKWPEG